MAKQTLLQSYISLNSVDFSNSCSKIELSMEVEDEDGTTFGSGGWSEVLAGLRSFELGLTFKQDVATGQLDQQLFALFGTVVPFEVRLNNSVVGVSNPKYTGSVLVKEHAPINGSVGDVAEVDVSFPGSGALVRATA
jgi:hypothetical protein